MEPSKPVIVLVTGAWHVPHHYQLLSNRLRHQGYVVQCPLLMTNNNARPPNMTLDDDVKQIRDMAVQVLDTGRDIVALMHSYGGVVGSNAFAGLGAADRKKGGHVKALVYMAAFIPLENESLAGIFGGQLPPFLSPNTEGTIDVHSPQWHFYHDLPLEEQNRCANELVVHPTIAQYESLREPPSMSAWRTIPVMYLFCSDDKALPVQVQEMMVGRIEQAEAGLIVDREYLPSSHTPFISVPDRIMAVMMRICAAGEQQQGKQPVLGVQELPVESNGQVVVNST